MTGKKKKEQVKYTVKIQSKCCNTEQYYNEDSEETVVCQTRGTIKMFPISE